MPTKIILVVGARPNFMKVAPIMREMAKYPQEFEQVLVHTGQHYDDNMSRVFFRDLGLAEPDVRLGVGSGTHAEQTAKVMLAFEPVLLTHKPDLVLVVGDVNSTLACALTAVKLHVPIAHVEAGLRSFDRRMPEEINRILTDALADYLFITSRDADENLRREGIPHEKIYFVGNVMVDTLLRYRQQASELETWTHYGVKPSQYVLLTLHRPSNVDDPAAFTGILDALAEIQQRIPIIFPAHPRTVKRVQELGLAHRLGKMKNLALTEPLSYLDFLCLMSHARMVLTDSGGIQEETTILGVPCLTLRENTERPVTVSKGTNVLVGNSHERIVGEALGVLDGQGKTGRVPELWDGQAAQRIVRVLKTRGRTSSP